MGDDQVAAVGRQVQPAHVCVGWQQRKAAWLGCRFGRCITDGVRFVLRARRCRIQTRALGDGRIQRPGRHVECLRLAERQQQPVKVLALSGGKIIGIRAPQFDFFLKCPIRAAKDTDRPFAVVGDEQLRAARQQKGRVGSLDLLNCLAGFRRGHGHEPVGLMA